jgi:hypothetical protein
MLCASVRHMSGDDAVRLCGVLTSVCVMLWYVCYVVYVASRE